MNSLGTPFHLVRTKAPGCAPVAKRRVTRHSCNDKPHLHGDTSLFTQLSHFETNTVR